jgi:peptidoglycan/LPS O-acetylase OafA/YrhL
MTLFVSHGKLIHTKYRPDIDGLRAIAVLSVVLFHGFPGIMPGGFIGVDIFFVISGYLISTIIFESLEKKTFSFLEFYARRIKRIFPALLLVLIFCLIFGWFALLTEEYKQLGKHVAGGAGFISNLLLWNESGYFDNSADTKPLLHLWSLGIEEQFYIIWPLLLWCSWKRHLNLLGITTFVCAMSFVLNIAKVDNAPVAAFYSPQTRFWELMAGSILAYFELHKRQWNQKIVPRIGVRLDKSARAFVCAHLRNSNINTLRNLQSMLGCLLVLAGFLFISKGSYFPGWWALLPTFGTVIIISSGQHAWLNRIVLSSRLLVWFGLISFPLYLWHWPLFSFSRIIESETPSLWIRAGSVLLSIILAWVTYRFVERSVRNYKNNELITISLFISMVITCCVGYSTFEKGGFGFRENATLTGSYQGEPWKFSYFESIAHEFYICTPSEIAINAERLDEGYVRCAQSKNNQDIEIVLIGDSHAERMFLGLAEELPDINIAYYIKNGSPFLNNPEFSQIYQAVVSSKTIKTVILTMNWATRANSSTEVDLLTTADRLIQSGKNVFITDDNPFFPFTPEKCMGKRWLSSRQECAVNEKDLIDTPRPPLSRIPLIDPRIKLLETKKYFCDEKDNMCSMVKDGVLLYSDRDHLNSAGSRYLAKMIIRDSPELLR